jgi:hypothetical protein
MVYFQERAFPPFFYGFLEGITTLSMPIGYLLAGGDWTHFLFWIYLIHFVVSFLNHLFPTKLTYFLDLSAINLMVMEREYLITKNLWVYVFFLLTILIEHEVSSFSIVARVFAFIFSFSNGQFSFVYIYLGVLVFVFYFLSIEFQRQDNMGMATFMCVLYHIYLGILSVIEVKLYDKSITNTTDGFVRYLSFFIFIAQFMVRLTENPKRLRSILSLITALVLSPLSIHQIWKQVQHGRIETYQGDEPIHYVISFFYLAYVIVDTLVGVIYYPKYFTFLEGWLHHFCSAFIVIYYNFVKPETRIVMCMNSIVEISSILLFISKIFYDVDCVQRIKKKIFFNVFLFFRIIVPTMIVVYFYRFYDCFGYCNYALFTFLNLYWLIKISHRY